MTDTTKSPTKKELAEYFELDKKRLALNAQARDISRVQGETEDKVLAYVRANGGPERCSIVSGYRLSIDLKADRVEWKTELLEALGKEVGKEKAVKIAAKITADAGQKEVPKIEPPAPASAL